MLDNSQIQAMMNCEVSGQNINYTQSGNYTCGNIITTTATSSDYAQTFTASPSNTLWGFWQNQYYPMVIRESYPTYIQERAMDKGTKAFEILKILMDKGLMKIEKVKDFIDAMDALIKTV